MIKAIIKITTVFMLSFLIQGCAVASDEMTGEQIYKAYCAGCHGIEGQGNRTCPSFTKDKERLAKSDDELLLSIKNGKGYMPPYKRMFSDEDILRVIEYLRNTFGDD